MNNYDPRTATTTDKVFVATMLKTIISDDKVKKGMPNSVSDYMSYVINKVIDDINSEITLDILKTMANVNEKEDEDEYEDE